MIQNELQSPGSRQRDAMAGYDTVSLTMSSIMAGPNEILRLNGRAHGHGQQMMGRLAVDSFESDMGYDNEAMM